MSLTTAATTVPIACNTAAITFVPSPVAIPAVRGEFALRLAMRHAGARDVAVRYELLGEAGLPVVFVAGGISAHRHVAASAAFPEAGWWQEQVGPGRAIDPEQHRVLSFDWIGAAGDLDTVIDPVDQADAIAALLEALQIERVETFVGASYGAMVGLQFAERHGARLGQLVAISGVHRAHPFSSAWRALQRQAVALGALQCDEAHGVALARQLAVLSYRSPEEFDARFGAPQVVDGRVRVGAEAYLAHCGQKYVERTSATAFLRLSESIDLQAVDPRRIALPVTVVAVAEDRLVPLQDAHALVEQLRGETRLCVLRSVYGHDAFLKEEGEIARILRTTLAEQLEQAA